MGTKDVICSTFAPLERGLTVRDISRFQEAEKALVHLLSSDNGGVLVAASQGIAIMAENLMSRDAIGRFDGVDPLIKLLSNESLEVRLATEHGPIVHKLCQGYTIVQQTNCLSGM